MEIYKDFLRIEKSKLRIVFGVLMIIFSIIIIPVKEVASEELSFLDWGLVVVFALNGILHITEGIGFSSNKLFGKAFILINNEKITIKTNVFAKEKTIYWSEIKTISYKINNYSFVTKNEKLLTLNLSKLDYFLVKNIKESVNVLAKKNKLEINNK